MGGWSKARVRTVETASTSWFHGLQESQNRVSKPFLAPTALTSGCSDDRFQTRTFGEAGRNGRRGRTRFLRISQIPMDSSSQPPMTFMAPCFPVVQHIRLAQRTPPNVDSRVRCEMDIEDVIEDRRRATLEGRTNGQRNINSTTTWNGYKHIWWRRAMWYKSETEDCSSGSSFDLVLAKSVAFKPSQVEVNEPCPQAWGPLWKKEYDERPIAATLGPFRLTLIRQAFVFIHEVGPPDPAFIEGYRQPDTCGACREQLPYPARGISIRIVLTYDGDGRTHISRRAARIFS